MKRLSILIALVAVVALLVPAMPSLADGPDWDLPGGGHFFTQTGGGSGKGYSITDDAVGIRFWSEFKRLGGVGAVGYPVSQLFQWNGFTCQAMQRVIFQWRSDSSSVAFVNVFDLLHDGGKDDWLAVARQMPKPVGPDFNAGLGWDQVVKKRVALLDANPAIKQQYFSVVGDPITMNGLPTSPVTDMGNNYTLRCQRIVIQQWKQDVPWAKAGQVTVANGGDIAKEAGLVLSGAIQPVDPDQAKAAPSTRFAGRGKQVSPFFNLDAGLTTFRMKHDGSSNFAIWVLDSGGRRIRLLINQIGPFDGVVALAIERAGQHLMDVTGDGNWEVIVEEAEARRGSTGPQDISRKREERVTLSCSR